MRIKNIHTLKEFDTTKEGWDKMNDKHKKLFEVVDAEDKPDTMEIKVSSNIEQLHTQNKKKDEH